MGGPGRVTSEAVPAGGEGAITVVDAGTVESGPGDGPEQAGTGASGAKRRRRGGRRRRRRGEGGGGPGAPGGAPSGSPPSSPPLG